MTEAAPITLVLHAHLSRYAADRSRVELPHREGAGVADYARELGIPPHEYYAVIRGGSLSKDLASALSPGELVELLPAISGG